MLDHIKFRGKRLDSGEWIIGNGIHFPKSINYIGTCWLDGGQPRANDWVQVDPETVGEYSGCDDVCKTEIYDGDIVRDRNEAVYEVKRICGAFYLLPQKMSAVRGYVPMLIDASFGLTIIGNIHDNSKREWIAKFLDRPAENKEPFCPFDGGSYCNDAYSQKCYECGIASEEFAKNKRMIGGAL